MLAGIQQDFAPTCVGRFVQPCANQCGADALSMQCPVDHAPAEMRGPAVRADRHAATADEAAVPLRDLKLPFHRLVI